MPPEFYMFDAAALPDDLHTPETPADRWLERCQTAGAEGFPANSLAARSPLDGFTHLERIVGVPSYLMLNVLPFALPLALVLPARFLLLPLSLYAGALLAAALPFIYFYRNSVGGILAPRNGGPRVGQYLYTERNTAKYLSLRLVWPRSVHEKPRGRPVLFLAVPHGFAPLGITGYSLWSKLFGPLCRWTCAPVVLKIPIVGGFMRRVGYIAAEKRAIEDALVKKGESVGVVLDGIAGMFCPGTASEEVAFVRSRKGIIKIALRAGATIVPVYGFGHTSLYRIVADPFGLLRALSCKLDTSVVLGIGRWCWPLGPPHRIAVTIALGEPIDCPHIDAPAVSDVDEWHARLLAGFKAVFDTHKAACGAAHKQLRFV